MSACCVSGCKNRHSSSSKLKFYRIPTGCRPFQANRRRLWLNAIQQVNGSMEELRGNARICGAHFVSGEASMDHDSPDFVPSVFTCQSPKKKGKGIHSHRKTRHHKAEVEDGQETRVDSAELAEETRIPASPSLPEEEETFSKVAETETTPEPMTETASFKLPAVPHLWKRIPTVLLKPVYLLAGGYRCELCDQNFSSGLQLVKHKRLHEEESCAEVEDRTEEQNVLQPSFLCNMCNRSFSSSQNLKRHKLQHVRDGRKCHKCGVLFCQLHKHVAFRPQSKSEQESSTVEPEPDRPDSESDSSSDDAAASPAPQSPGASSKVYNPLPPASHRRIITEIPNFIKCSCYSSTPPEVRYSRDKYPASLGPLPPALKMFSPQYLTSALFDVKRDYKYILSKAKKKKKKEEPLEPPLNTSSDQTVVELQINL